MEQQALVALFGHQGEGFLERKLIRELQIEGDQNQIESAFELIIALKGVPTCGNIESHKSCEIGGPMCPVHVNCIYKP